MWLKGQWATLGVLDATAARSRSVQHLRAVLVYRSTAAASLARRRGYRVVPVVRRSSAARDGGSAVGSSELALRPRVRIP